MHEPISRPARLLIAWDGTPESSASIPCALALAAPAAHLVLLHIAPVAATRLPLSGPVLARRAELHTHRLDVACAAMRRLGADIALFRPDLTIDVVCAQGAPAQEIERVASEREAELIVAVLHHERAMRGAAHQSVAVQLARDAPIPTLIVRGGTPRAATQLPFRRLLCPVIASKPNTRSLRAVSQLAIGLTLPARIVAVIDPAVVLPAPMMRGVAPRFGDVEQVYAAHRERVAAMLDQSASELRAAGVAVTSGMEHGPIAESICAAAVPGDLIVINPDDLDVHDGGRLLARFLREAPAPILILPARSAQRPRAGAARRQPARMKGSTVHV